MKKQFSLKELASLTNATMQGDPDFIVDNVDNLESACEKDVSFLANPRYREAMLQSKAGVICIDEKAALLEGKNFLISKDPSKTFQQIAEILISLKEEAHGFEGIHPSAVIHKTVTLGEGVSIGPNVVIGKNSTIGAHTTIIASSYIGHDVIVGEHCVIHPNVTVREGCILYNRVILQPGAVIGSCGFGYQTDLEGNHHKLKQLGNVILEDDVEIGANTTIDRARFKSTIIKKGTKIDNLVQIAHNVIAGEKCIIVSQTGIAGSAVLEDGVFLGGQVGVLGHVHIEKGNKFATRSGVSKSIKTKDQIYRGSPAIPIAKYNKEQVYLRRIKQYADKIEELEKRIAKLEG